MSLNVIVASRTFSLPYPIRRYWIDDTTLSPVRQSAVDKNASSRYGSVFLGYSRILWIDLQHAR